MTTLIVCLVAFVASGLTFFSGFGLGTLLLPAFVLFFPVEIAVASTAVVHFLNGLFKLTLVGRHAHRRTILRFGVPAIVAAFLGAWLFVGLAAAEPVASYTLGDIRGSVEPAKLTIGGLLLVAAGAEMSRRFRSASIGPTWVPLGGVLSGFLGGLSGMQGALRSAFLIRLGLSKEAFIGTGVAVAVLVDISRLGVYARGLLAQRSELDYLLLGAAVLAAFAGAALGNRFLSKLTLGAVQRIVGAMLMLAALGLVAGLL